MPRTNGTYGWCRTVAKGPSHSGFEPRTRDPERRDFFDLRRRIAALENGSGGGGGSGAEEVFIGPNDPGLPFELWYDTDAVSPSGAIVQEGTYTPAWTLFNPGSTGVVSAHYIFVGGPAVGDFGVLTIQIAVTTGGSGIVFWTSGHRFGLPAGFNWFPVNHAEEGQATFEDVSLADRYYGHVSCIGNAICSVGFDTVVALNAGLRGGTLSSTSPFPWAAGDKYYFAITAKAKRV